MDAYYGRLETDDEYEQIEEPQHGIEEHDDVEPVHQDPVPEPPVEEEDKKEVNPVDVPAEEGQGF